MSIDIWVTLRCDLIWSFSFPQSQNGSDDCDLHVGALNEMRTHALNTMSGKEMFQKYLRFSIILEF